MDELALLVETVNELFLSPILVHTWQDRCHGRRWQGSWGAHGEHWADRGTAVGLAQGGDGVLRRGKPDVDRRLMGTGLARLLPTRVGIARQQPGAYGGPASG